MSSFGQRLRELRQASQFSLRDLANRVHVTPAYLCDIELGRRFPSDKLLLKLARTLRVKSDELGVLHPRSIFREVEDRIVHDAAYADVLRRVLRLCATADELSALIERGGRIN